MTSASQGSRGPAILQKLKNNKSKQNSRIEAVETVVNHPNLGRDVDNTCRVLTKAMVSWQQVNELRYHYEALLDEAFEVLGDSNADLMAELATNNTNTEWCESVESRLEEMLLMKDKPEKRDADTTV